MKTLLRDRRFRFRIYAWVATTAAAGTVALSVATMLISKRLDAEYRSDALIRAGVQACSRIQRTGTWRESSVEGVSEPERPPVLVHVDVSPMNARALQLTLTSGGVRSQTLCPRPRLPATTKEAFSSASLAG